MPPGHSSQCRRSISSFSLIVLSRPSLHHLTSNHEIGHRRYRFTEGATLIRFTEHIKLMAETSAQEGHSSAARPGGGATSQMRTVALIIGIDGVFSVGALTSSALGVWLVPLTSAATTNLKITTEKVRAQHFLNKPRFLRQNGVSRRPGARTLLRRRGCNRSHLLLYFTPHSLTHSLIHAPSSIAFSVIYLLRKLSLVALASLRSLRSLCRRIVLVVHTQCRSYVRSHLEAFTLLQ